MINTKGLLKAVSYHKTKIRFFILFILFFVISHTVLYIYRNQTTPILVYKLHAETGSKLINFLFPHEQTTFQDGIIESDAVKLNILWGCEGVDGILILISALLAYPARIWEKIIGIVVGSIIIYFSNLFRLVVLYFTVKFKPALFDVMHMYIGQTFYIFVIILFFITWVLAFDKIREKGIKY